MTMTHVMLLLCLSLFTGWGLHDVAAESPSASLLTNGLNSGPLLVAEGRPEHHGREAADQDSKRIYYTDSEQGDDSHDGLSEGRAWRSLDRINAAKLRPGDTVRLKCGSVWRGSLRPCSGNAAAPITYTSYGQGPKPLILGSRPRNQPENWVQIDHELWATLPIEDPQGSEPHNLDVDVGNLIFDDGKVCGWKKWSMESLEKDYDYYYDVPSQRIFLVSSANPATRHKSIECALKRHLIDQSNAHDVIYDGLALRCGAAHGFGGGNTQHITIRHCDLCYIGGGHQFTRPDGTPVRYGNAIEFWGAARDHLVENCRIWQVYDAALTNQNNGNAARQENIVYRNNIIWNCEYSFEYWNHPETSVTQNVHFINNTCAHAWIVWSHAQRPDPNGSHLMFYSNTADTSGLEVKYNIFYQVSDWGSRYTGGWKTFPEMDHNLWFSDQGVMANWFGKKLDTFETYQRTTGLDKHSIFTDPHFVDPGAGDYRLAPDSPARTLRPGGGPVGAEYLSIFRIQPPGP